MTIDDETRKAAVQARQKAEHLEETLRERAETSIDEHQSGQMSEEMRELAVQQRQQEKHEHENLLSRAEESIAKASETNPD